VNGFEVNAVDYLVKPFPFERFVKAMGKLQSILNVSSQKDAQFITLQADKKIHKIDIDQILFLEAMGDYVKVVMAGKTLIVHQTLQKLLEQLPPALFYRVHKSYAIALNKLEYVEGNQIIIKSSRVPIGQTYRNEFLEVLQKK
jgi:DNA-binding LytR/AlgR family response regulator